MTTLIIPKQPTHFRYCSLCQCMGDYCVKYQLAQFNDNFSFQMQDPEIFLGEELFVNLAGEYIGDFENHGIQADGWQNDGSGTNAWARSNVAPLADTWSARVQLDSDIISNTETLSGKFSTGDYVRLQVLHSALDSGCDLEIYYTIGAGFVLLTTISGAAAQATFTYNFVNTFGDITGFGFKYVVGCTGEGYRAIDNVSVKTYDLTKFKIFDCCDSSEKAVLDATKFTITEDYLTFDDLWSNYVSAIGYYKICVDDIDLVQNGTFTHNLDNWTNIGSNTEFTYVSGAAVAVLIGAGSTDELRQSINLPSKCSFPLTFSATGVNITQVDVYVNGVLYESFENGGTLTSTITSKKPITSFGIVVTTGGASTVTLDNVTMPVDICSDCFNLATAHDCSYLLESTQTNDAFGFEFDGTFTMYQRLYSDLFKYTPEYDQLNHKSSAGVNTQVYADLTSIFEFKVYRIPSYVIDAILVMVILNNVLIDGERYVKNEGSTELDWDQKREFASTIFEMVMRTENNQNTYS